MIKTVPSPHATCVTSYIFSSIVRHIVHRAAGDEPHHQLDALAASFTHVVYVRRAGLALRVGNQAVQKRLVKLFVDQSGTRALQLVADGAGSAVLSRNAVSSSIRPSAFSVRTITAPVLRTKVSMATSSWRPTMLTQQTTLKLLHKTICKIVCPI